MILLRLLTPQYSSHWMMNSSDLFRSPSNVLGGSPWKRSVPPGGRFGTCGTFALGSPGGSGGGRSPGFPPKPPPPPPPPPPPKRLPPKPKPPPNPPPPGGGPPSGSSAYLRRSSRRSGSLVTNWRRTADGGSGLSG